MGCLKGRPAIDSEQAALRPERIATGRDMEPYYWDPKSPGVHVLWFKRHTLHDFLRSRFRPVIATMASLLPQHEGWLPSWLLLVRSRIPMFLS